MKTKCKRCGKNAESEYCFRCKPKKQIPHSKKSGEQIKMRRVATKSLISVFFEIWNERTHRSEISNTPLGKEPLTVYFHHCLPKRQYPEAALDKEGIILLTSEEHEKVENDPDAFEKVVEIRERMKEKYDGLRRGY